MYFTFQVAWEEVQVTAVTAVVQEEATVNLKQIKFYRFDFFYNAHFQ